MAKGILFENKSFSNHAPGTRSYADNYAQIDWGDDKKKDEQWAIIEDGGDEWKGGYSSKESAIAAAKSDLDLSVGDKFKVARCHDGFHPVDAKDIIDLMHDRATDEHWGDSEYPDASKEAVAELDEFLKAWMIRHKIKPDWFEVGDEEIHTVPAPTEE